MTHAEQGELRDLLRWNAARFRLPALPQTWPEWMTREKRISMAANFEAIAGKIDAALTPAKVDEAG